MICRKSPSSSAETISVGLIFSISAIYLCLSFCTQNCVQRYNIFLTYASFYTKNCHCTIAELHIIFCRWRALYNIIYYYNDYLFEIVEATLLCNFAILRERAKKNKKLCKKVAKKFGEGNLFIVPLQRISGEVRCFYCESTVTFGVRTRCE